MYMHARLNTHVWHREWLTAICAAELDEIVVVLAAKLIGAQNQLLKQAQRAGVRALQIVAHEKSWLTCMLVFAAVE